MSPLKKATVAALAAMLLVSGWQYHHRQTRLREAERLRAEIDQMRLQASQRHEAQLLKARLAVPTTSSAAASVAQSSVLSSRAKTEVPAPELSRMPRTDYRNEGQATPIKALQTFAWACDQGDATLMEKLLVFDAVAREKTAAYFASLPPEARPQSVSFESLAAALYISDGMKHPYPTAEVLQRARFEPINPARMVLRLPGANGDGYEFQQTTEGWKVAVTEAIVDDYIRQSQQQAQP